jgi:hypothetical protein
MSQSNQIEDDIAVISRSGLFDESWYLEHYHDVGTANLDPLLHYVLHGEKEGRQPSADMKVDRLVGDIEQVLQTGRSALADYILGHDPCNQIDIIGRSGLFDAEWYVSQYEDVRNGEVDPLRHYVFYGAQEGRLPNDDPHFARYLQELPPEVLGSQNPLLHYALSGRLEPNISIIAKSGLFDADWYLKMNQDIKGAAIDPISHYVLYGDKEGRQPNAKLRLAQYAANVTKDVIKGRNKLVHYILHGQPEQLIDPGQLKSFSLATLQRAITRLKQLPLYDAADYVKMNSDIQASVKAYKVDPTGHALAYGVPEGRHVFRTIRIAKVLGEFARRPMPEPAALQEVPPLPPIGVYFNGAGNVFLKELAQELVDSIRFLGLDARLLDEKTDPKQILPIPIIVAPHEFFHLGDGKKWIDDEIISRAFMYNTEQPQTIWFERAIPFILASKAVIDICLQIADIFGACGLPAIHFNPNATAPKSFLQAADKQHSLYRILPEQARKTPNIHTPFAQRPIDLCFFGSASRSRELFFSKNARFLSDYQAFLYYRKFTGPLKADGRDGVLSRIGSHVTAHSKIALNIHRDEMGFFEWHRLVKQGMVGGAVVVTEPCLPHPVFKPGTHFLEEAARHIPDLIEWLTKTKEGGQTAAAIQAANATITDESHARANSLALASFLQTHGAGA